MFIALPPMILIIYFLLICLNRNNSSKTTTRQRQKRQKMEASMTAPSVKKALADLTAVSQLKR